jgi:hypothetical protein
MNFKQWLETNSYGITQHPNGTLTINPEQYDQIPDQTWDKIYKHLKKQGYDLRSPQDTKERLRKWHSYDGDHAQAILQAITPQTRTPRTPNQKLITKIKKHFGTTPNPKKAGYILPDGTMLNLTTPWSPTRDLDHREINQFIDDPNGNSLGPIKLFGTQHGAIRIGITQDHAHINIYKQPTPKQYTTLQKILHQVQETTLDCTNDQNNTENLDNRHYQQYNPHTRPQTILQHIKNYYQQQTKYTS